MRLLGLDPGLRHTGWGVLEVEGSRLRFVVLTDVGTPEVLTDPPEDLLRAAYAKMTGR